MEMHSSQQRWRSSNGIRIGKGQPPALGVDDLETRHAFGAKWIGPHSFDKASAETTMDVYRDGFENLTNLDVNSTPYADYIYTNVCLGV